MKTIPERWRRSLGSLDRLGPDEATIRRLATGERRTREPGSATATRRVVAAVAAVALAVASFVLVRSAFVGPDRNVVASGIDPRAVCDVPAYDPDVTLLVGDRVEEYASRLLDRPGEPASSLDGPGADGLRAYVDSPAGFHAPDDGWRAIAEEPSEVRFAAPDDDAGRWWLVIVELRDGRWRPDPGQLVDREPTPAQRGRGLRLTWSGDVVLQNGTWASPLELENEASSAWTDADVSFNREHWGLPHVFDIDTGREIDAATMSFAPGADPLRIPAGGRASVPLALGRVGTSLEPGSYAVVACVPDLALASPIGTLRVVDGPADAGVHVLSARAITGMEALALGTLTVRDGCLAIGHGQAGGRATYLIWPYGYALVERPGRTVLIDPVGQELAALGDEVRLVGGSVPARFVEDSVVGAIPEACHPGGEGYFVTSGPADQA